MKTPGEPTVLVVQHEEDGGPDLMLPSLSRAAELRIVRPDLGEALPESLAGLDAVVVLGGEMGALDDERAPWLPRTRALMKDAVSSAVPVLGICLGAQLLAAATGGSVGRGAVGLEIGLVEVSPLEASVGDPFLAPVAAAMKRAGHADRWPVAQYHYDTVTGLPPGAELLVTGDRYRVQAFRVGERGYGVQFHPEVSAAGFATWVGNAKSTGELPAALDVVPAVAARQAAQRTLAEALTDSLINMADTNRRSGSRDTLSR